MPSISPIGRPAQPSTAPAPPLLAQGIQGPHVFKLQSALKAKGFNPGPVDGDFGPLTEAAVRKFQAAQGLGVDGMVDPRPGESFSAGPPNRQAKPAPPPAPLPSRPRAASR